MIEPIEPSGPKRPPIPTPINVHKVAFNGDVDVVDRQAIDILQLENGKVVTISTNYDGNKPVRSVVSMWNNLHDRKPKAILECEPIGCQPLRLDKLV